MTIQTNRNARILVLSELFLPTKGGTAVWAAEVYKRLGGKDIHIVTADVPDAAAFDATHPNTVHRLNLRRVPWLRPESLLMYWRFFARSLRLALTHRFDAVHAFRALPEGLVAWLVGLLSGHPVVIYSHGEELTTWGKGGKYKALRFTLQHANTVIANSEHTRNCLLGMGILPTKINVIYPGVDIHLFKPGLDTADLRNSIDISQTDLLVFSVGRLSRRKGFDQMIRAVSLLHSEGMNIHYVIGGIGEDSDYLDKLIWEHGTENFIHRIGAVSEADLPRWMNACDIFAMPNREINGDNEGFGMVFIEASACGKPVLAGISGGTGAAVLDNVTGLRVDGTSVECIANGLRQILGDRQLAINLGNNGLERTIEMFSWERVANITESLHTKRKAEQ